MTPCPKNSTYVFFSQHLGDLGDLGLGSWAIKLIFWHYTWLILPMRLTDNQRNHGGSISPGGLKALDELLDLPYLDLHDFHTNY